MADELKAPTQTVMVQTNMVGGVRIRGLLHLPPTSGEGAATGVGRVLNAPDVRFVPVTPTTGSTRDRTVLVQLSQVLSAELEAAPSEDPPLDTVLPANVMVPPDTVYAGAVLASLPRSERRLSDALNRAERFVRMRVGPKVVFVNTAHITSVVERDAV